MCPTDHPADFERRLFKARLLHHELIRATANSRCNRRISELDRAAGEWSDDDVGSRYATGLSVRRCRPRLVLIGVAAGTCLRAREVVH